MIHCHRPAEISRTMETGEVSSTYCSPHEEGPSMSWEHHESTKRDQATGGQSDLDPERDALKWMKKCQCSYTEEQRSFWTLLCPHTDSGETSSQHLVH